MSLYWTIWFLAGFGIPEAVALLTGHPENTLSEFVWRLFGVRTGQSPTQWSFAHFVLVALLIWLLFHFGWRLFR